MVPAKGGAPFLRHVIFVAKEKRQCFLNPLLDGDEHHVHLCTIGQSTGKDKPGVSGVGVCVLPMGRKE